MPRRFPLNPGTCFLLSVVFLGVLPQPSEADLFYRVEKVIHLTDSGLNPAADGTIPMSVTGLNDAGAFVGYFPSATANKLHAFLWDNPHQSFIDLNNLLAADSSMATCLNDEGTVAGVFWELGTYAERGFVYHADGTVDTFTAPDGGGGNVTAVTALNATGDLIGTYLAADGTTRGFILQQASNPATVTDLGDLGQAGYVQYIWPNALNEDDQIVGNEYLLPTESFGPRLTRGFFWDAGILPIDASNLGSNWTAVALNDEGQAIGTYGSLSTGNLVIEAGSYYWDPGTGDVDLGDLGGGAGANVFALTDYGYAVGTSLSGDGTLHLFTATTGNAVSDQIVDVGSVSLYDGDASFWPLSLNSTVVRNKPGTMATAVYNVAGFGTDADGNTLSLLWMNNGIHSVVDLMPAHLSFATVSHAYGSLVLINDSKQIACAGTDSNGNQMALLLSVDPDTDNDGLPDSWEMQYYGHLGVDKGALETSGGGLTNWDAYQQGTNPVDFYDGQTPSPSIVSGDSQIAAPGSFVPTPLIVQITDANGNPIPGAPVTFTVTSGDGRLQVSRQTSPKTTVTVLTDANGQAKVFFQVSNTAGVASGVTAVLTGANLATVGTFSGMADNSGPVNPTPTDPDNPPTSQDVPVQGYASVDISGGVQADSDVEWVVLKDSGDAAFWFISDNTCTTYQYSNGQSNYVQDLSLMVGSDTASIVYYPELINSRGTIFGNRQGYNEVTYDWYGSFMYQDDNPTQIAPHSPYQAFTVDPQHPNYTYYNISLSNVVDSGYCGVAEGFLNLPDPNDPSKTSPQESYGGTIFCNGSTVLFDPNLLKVSYSDPSVHLVGVLFYPEHMNSTGSAVGAQAGGSGYTAALWDGTAQALIGISNINYDSANGINDQNQVIVGNSSEGYLWENGVVTTLASHLPAELVGQISGIQPYCISNQTTLGTDATIYILATATVNGVDDTTIVCTRDNDGDWSFAQVGVPDGVTINQYTTINSQGVIAGIGNLSPATGTNNAGSTTNDPTPDPSTQQAGLFGPLTVASVSFVGDKCWKLKSDDSKTTYTAPQWADKNKKAGVKGWDATASNPDEHDNAVAYSHDSVLTIGATFNIPKVAGDAKLLFKATGSDGISIPPTVGTSNGTTWTIQPTPSTVKLPSTIKYYNKSDNTAFALQWQYSADNGKTWSAKTTTKHTVYVILSDTKPTSTQETVLYLACKNQGTAVVPSTVADTIWNQFTSLKTCRVGTNQAMQYYGTWANSGAYDKNDATTANLLATGDGRCEAWALLLNDVFKVQGISGIYESINPISPINPQATLTDDHNLGIVINSSLAGQGPNQHPFNYFANHALISFGGALYDPSYGKPYTGRQNWEDIALDSITYSDSSGRKKIVAHTAGVQQTKMTP